MTNKEASDILRYYYKNLQSNPSAALYTSSHFNEALQVAIEALEEKEFKLNNEVTIVFVNKENQSVDITVLIDDLLEKTKDDFYDLLEKKYSPRCSCINESNTHCVCDTLFDDYEISKIITN